MTIDGSHAWIVRVFRIAACSSEQVAKLNTRLCGIVTARRRRCDARRRPCDVWSLRPPKLIVAALDDKGLCRSRRLSSCCRHTFTKRSSSWSDSNRSSPSISSLTSAACPCPTTPPSLSTRRTSTETTPIEQRADGVVTLHHDDGDDGAAALGIIVEVQLEPDYKKHYTWPAYLVSLRNRLKAPVVVLVICPRPHSALGGTTHTSGRQFENRTLVIGPADVPAITDPEVARGHPELAMLSAITHHENHAVPDALFATFTPDIERSYVR